VSQRVIVSSVYVVAIRGCYLFLNVLKIEIPENLGISCAILQRHCLFLVVIVLSAGLDLSGRIETEQ
jgi:hypothetical protein